MAAFHKRVLPIQQNDRAIAEAIRRRTQLDEEATAQEIQLGIDIKAVEDDMTLSTDQTKLACDTLRNVDMRQYNEREKKKSHIAKTQHTAQEAVDKMGQGNPNKPTDLVFRPPTLFECAKDTDRRSQYNEALRTYIDSYKGYKRMQCNVHLMLDHYTDNEGCLEITRDIDKHCRGYSQDALEIEMGVFAKQLCKLTTAISQYNTKLEKAGHGQVRPRARGGKPGNDAQETVPGKHGLRHLEILSRVCLALTAQIKKDLKTKIEQANRDVKKLGNPIALLNTVTKRDLKMYTELEQQIDCVECLLG